MNFPTNWRERRTFLAPSRDPFASYCTDVKSEMRKTFGEDLLVNSLCWGPDPLRKNLADTIMKQEKMAPKNGKIKLETEKVMKVEENTHEDNSTLSGITSFISGVVNVISNAMFSKRKPADFSSESRLGMALPSMWHAAKLSDENKILQDEISDDISSEFFTSEMGECRSAADHCRSKLEQVRVLLGASKPVPCSLRRRRPKKLFVEAGSVEDCFEDAFSPEDFENLTNDSFIEFSSPVCYHEQWFHEVDGPKVKVDTDVAPKMALETSKSVAEDIRVLETQEKNLETVQIINETSQTRTTVSEKPTSMFETQSQPPIIPDVNTVPEKLVCETMDIVKHVSEPNFNNDKLVIDSKKELVESCEDKITKLKLLLQERRKKPKVVAEPELEPAPLPLTLEPQVVTKLPPRPKSSSKVKDKRFKNPNRCSDKRRKSKMRKNINDDALFANDLNYEEVSSLENSPSTNNMVNYIRKTPVLNCTDPKPIQKEYFDEVSGRFHSMSADSEDSFQIVFNDSPKLRRQSDCDSEDSFIIFEDSPDSCYTSNDVFGDSDLEEYDSDSDFSDSGCGTFKLSASLSKSVSNLADDSLYEDHSEDEVDNVKPDFTVCDNLTVGDNLTVNGDLSGDCGTGVLLNERKKLLRKDLPAKRVHFSPNPPKVHVMRVWLFAAKQTRIRYWEQFVTDRDRFKRRIADVDMAVSWVLKPQHRSRVMFQRFMPWWNAQKRKEIAEKKERDALEKEEERLRNEERQKEENLEDGVNEIVVNENNTEERKEVKWKDTVAEERRGDNNSLIIKEINCHSVEELNEKNLFDKENLDKISDKIVPYNEKILDLKTEHVSGILNT